jgi:hypothetical protein
MRCNKKRNYAAFYVSLKTVPWVWPCWKRWSLCHRGAKSLFTLKNHGWKKTLLIDKKNKTYKKNTNRTLRVLRHGPSWRVPLAHGRRGYHPLRRVQPEGSREHRLLTNGMAISLAMLPHTMQGEEQAIEEHLDIWSTDHNGHCLGLLGNQ